MTLSCWKRSFNKKHVRFQPLCDNRGVKAIDSEVTEGGQRLYQ